MKEAHRSPTGSTIAQRLEFLSIPEPNSGCLLWLGKLCRGYPSMTIDGVTRRANRVALEQKLGRPLLPTEFALHKCDVQICINEDHLFPGTHDDNMADMARKGRGANKPGSNARVPADIIRAILADRRSHSAIARTYGVSKSHVTCLKRGTRRLEVPRPDAFRF